MVSLHCFAQTDPVAGSSARMCSKCFAQRIGCWKTSDVGRTCRGHCLQLGPNWQNRRSWLRWRGDEVTRSQLTGARLWFQPAEAKNRGFPGPILATHLKMNGQYTTEHSVNHQLVYQGSPMSPISQRFAGETFDQFQWLLHRSADHEKRYVWTLIIGIPEHGKPMFLSCWDLAQIDPYPLVNIQKAIENGPVEIVDIFPLIAWWFSMANC